MAIVFLERLPRAEEYNGLRQKVGWGTYEKAIIEESLPRSLYSICCCDSNRIIGMGRVIGDAKMCFYIQDIVIDPDFQGQGLGSEIMKRIMGYINENRCENSIVGLMAAKGKEPFYEKFGFACRPSEKFGNGMHFIQPA
ncbi:MAG: GNAT family N-acetyltransferase [Spirochaetales bacterium]|nr:GNAT family N-acetyltransferase [Spirochaetales bacterium]